MADDTSLVSTPVTEEALGPCVVCGEDLDPTHHTECEGCMQPFHMRMTEGVEAKDCGYIWYDEASCASLFFCHPCFARVAGTQ